MGNEERACLIKEMAKTMTTKEIAEKLSCSPSLVRYHANGGKDGKYRKKRPHEVKNALEKVSFTARKLSLSECFSLMDIPEAYEPVKETVSKAKGYKIAGNAIVKNCLVAVIGQMFEGHEEDYETRS